MAKETFEAKLARYQGDLKRAQDFRQKEGYDDLWARMVDLYRGKHYATMTEKDRVVVNLSFTTVNIIGPSVAVNNPKFIVRARKHDHAAQAVHVQEILNYMWRTHKFKTEFRAAVKDSLIVGHGWLKTGYKFVKEVKEVAVEDGEADGPGIDDRDDTEGNVESEIVVADDRPFLERVSYKDMFVDPDAKNMNTLRWIAQRTTRPVNDVKVDARYDKASRKKVSATSRKMSGTSNDDNPHEESDSIGYVDIIEFYDLKARTVCTFAARNGSDTGFLRKPEPIPYTFGHPFEMVRNYEIPDYFYPMGELEQIEALQHELNATRSDMLNHRRHNAKKWLVDESRIDKAGRDAIESDEDGVCIPVLGGDNPANAIAPLPGQGISADMYNMSGQIESDINGITATSDYQRGASQSSVRKTATESAMIQDAANARAGDKLADIEGVLARLGQRVIQLMQQYMTGKQSMLIVGSDAIPTWLEYNKEYIKGEFDFEVDGGSTEPRNESFVRQAALQLMDVMAPFVSSGVVDPAALARKLLRDFGVKNPDEFLMAGPPMMEGAAPAGPPPMGGPPMAPPPPIDEPMPPGMGGIDAALLNQLQGQVGLEPQTM